MNFLWLLLCQDLQIQFCFLQSLFKLPDCFHLKYFLIFISATLYYINYTNTVWATLLNQNDPGTSSEMWSGSLIHISTKVEVWTNPVLK